MRIRSVEARPSRRPLLFLHCTGQSKNKNSSQIGFSFFLVLCHWMKQKLLPISELIFLDSSKTRMNEKQQRDAWEENEIPFCVPEIKLERRRSDSITRQISLNKQFVLPARACIHCGDEERAANEIGKDTNRSCVITGWCLDYDGNSTTPKKWLTT